MANSFSYWEQTSFLNNADVIIIGSGLVGLSAALYLKELKSSLSVVVLERGFLPTGASTKNAGFACFGTVSEILENIEASSEDEAIQLAYYRWRGLQQLRKTLGDANIDFKQYGGYELFFDNNGRSKICSDKIEYLNNLMERAFGESDIYSVADAKIADFGFKNVQHLLYNRLEGQIDTGKMMRALLQKVSEKGVLILNNCQINEINHLDGGVVLSTDKGNIKARKAILATNAFASQLFPELDVKPGRGQVLVTKPIENLRLKGTYHFEEGYYYFRNIHNRVLFGGGRNLDFDAEQTFEFGHTDTVKNKLKTYLSEVILPGYKVEPEYWWSGIMGFGNQLKPIIKQLRPHLYCAVRCNGMGVAMGNLVGKEVAELLLKTHL